MKLTTNAQRILNELFQQDFADNGSYADKSQYFEVFSSKQILKSNDLSDEEIYKYIETNEPMDKAGAYAIQGIASRYIKSINGDYYAIMGLPVSKLYHILKDIYNY